MKKSTGLNAVLIILYCSAAFFAYLSFTQNPTFYTLPKYGIVILNIVYFILLGLVNYFYFRDKVKSRLQTFIYLLTVLGYLALAYALFACFTREFHIVAVSICVGSFFYILSDGIGELKQENEKLKAQNDELLKAKLQD